MLSVLCPTIFMAPSQVCPLEAVAKPHYDSPVAAILIPLQTESRIRHDRIRDSKVAGVERIVELRSDLQTLSLSQTQILVDPEVHTGDSVRAQDVATSVSQRICSSHRRKQASPTGCNNFLDGHGGQI